LYPLGKLYSYFITAELFTYSYEKINTKVNAIDQVQTTTRGLSGSTIIPLNNILGTTAGINEVIDDEADLFNVDRNEPCT
jgi:hypothetical protein